MNIFTISEEGFKKALKKIDDMDAEVLMQELIANGLEVSQSGADDLFRKLGYTKVDRPTWGNEYRKDFKMKKPRHIVFGLDKEVCVCEENAIRLKN